MNLCSSFAEELGEEEIYEIYRQDPDDSKVLEKSLCKGSGIFGICNSSFRPSAMKTDRAKARQSSKVQGDQDQRPEL